MSAGSNATPDAAAHSPGAPEAPAGRSALATTRPLYWSVRRELWEHRSITIAPLAVAVLALLGFVVSLRDFPARMRVLPTLDPGLQSALLARPYGLASSVILMTGILVALFYCLDALHGERRDRSILFWKSMPVSDLTTVLAKAFVPLAAAPAIAFAIALVTQWIMLALSTALLLANGLSPAVQWSALPVFQMAATMLYGVVVHVLWYAPVYAWLLLVSAWARRATFVWALLPFLALMIVERLAFGTWHVASMLHHRVLGAMTEAFADDALHAPITQLSQLEPLRFLSSAGLWIGLAVSAAVIIAAVRLRRYQDPL